MNPGISGSPAQSACAACQPPRSPWRGSLLRHLLLGPAGVDGGPRGVEERAEGGVMPDEEHEVDHLLGGEPGAPQPPPRAGDSGISDPEIALERILGTVSAPTLAESGTSKIPSSSSGCVLLGYISPEIRRSETQGTWERISLLF
eukprot:gene5579-biopygen11759